MSKQRLKVLVCVFPKVLVNILVKVLVNQLVKGLAIVFVFFYLTIEKGVKAENQSTCYLFPKVLVNILVKVLAIVFVFLLDDRKGCQSRELQYLFLCF